MAVTVVESATQSATGLHMLGSGTSAPGVYVCQWNLDAMTGTAVIRCFARQEVLNTDTAADACSGYYEGVDGGGSPIVTSPPLILAPASGGIVQCGVEEIGANTVSIPWSLNSIG